jgi:hypothetical protein
MTPVLWVIDPWPPCKSGKTLPQLQTPLPISEGLCEHEARGVFRSKLSHSELHQTQPRRNPKKVVVKSHGFPYLFQQMHRVGAGVNGIYPEMHVPKKYNNQTTTNIEEPE